MRSLKSLRDARKNRKRDMSNAITAIGTAGAVAYVRGRFPRTREVQGVETDFALGGLALAAGMAGVGGKRWSDNLLFAGIGLTCPAVAERLYKLGEEHQ